jgi:hypothetical protein
MTRGYRFDFAVGKVTDVLLCDNCGRKIEPGDERDLHTFGSWSEPGGIEPDGGCVKCCPSADDEAAAYDAHIDRKIDAYRERDL